MLDDEEFAKVFVSSINHDLNLNVRFHNEIRRLMHNEIVTINLALEDGNSGKDTTDLKFQKSSLAGSFSDYSLNNSFLMQWSLTEEILYQIHQFRYSNIQKTSSFKKYKPMFQAAVGDPFSYAPWQFLITAERVRNCLLHANARVSLTRDVDWLNAELSRNKNFYKVSNGRISVTGEFINKLTDNVRDILKNLMANN